MQPIEAMYEDGVLKPAKSLPLRPGEHVGVILVRRPDPSRWDLHKLAAAAEDDDDLASAGLDAWVHELELQDRS